MVNVAYVHKIISWQREREREREERERERERENTVTAIAKVMLLRKIIK